MNNRQLEAFRMVMNTGSMSVAAQRLGISQPAVSRLIRDLEQTLAFTLFDRRHNRVYPTSAATAFAREVERYFIGLDHLADSAAQIRLMRDENLRVAAPPAFTGAVLAPLSSRFLEQHPNTSLSCSAQSSELILSQVAAGQCDLGVVLLPVEQTGVRIVAEYRVSCQCIAPAGHRFADQKQVAASDLDREPFVHLTDRQHPVRYAAEQVLRDQLVRPDSRIDASDMAAVAALVRAGAGVALADPFTASQLPDCVVRDFTPQVTVAIALIIPAATPQTALQTRFLEQLESHLAYRFRLTPT